MLSVRPSEFLHWQCLHIYRLQLYQPDVAAASHQMTKKIIRRIKSFLTVLSAQRITDHTVIYVNNNECL